MFFGNNTTGEIYVIDLAIGQTASLFSTGPVSSFNDGAKVTTIDTDGSALKFRDTDTDGIADHLDLDSDNDGISDLIESGQNASVVDADGDGTHNDGDESYTADGVSNDANGGAGVTPIDSLNAAGDSLPDILDLDSDDDGIPDTVEAQPTSNYSSTGGEVDANGVNTAVGLVTPEDTDGDSTPDYLDTDSDDNLGDKDGDDTSEAGVSTPTDATYKDPDGSINDPINDLTNDDLDFSDADYRSLDIAPNNPPTIPVTTFNAAENQTAVGDITATDTEDSTEGAPNGLTYEITGNGADDGKFDINSNTGVLTFKVAPDFENPNDADRDKIYQVEVKTTDSGGLTATETITVNLTDIDDTPPVPPTIKTPIEVDDVVDTTEVEDVLVEGTAEADSTIDVKFTDPDGNQVTAQATTDLNGDWTLTGKEVDLTPLDDGPVTVEAISTDKAGNPSNPVTATITLDKTPPVTPTIKTPIEVDDIVDAVEVSDVLVEGTAEADSTIDVKFTDPDGNQVTAQAATDPNGDWTLTGKEVDLTPLDDGPVTVEAISTDKAGNPSNPVTATITLDKTPPVPPTIKTPIEVDDIVDAVEVGDVLVEGKAEPDSTIDVKFTDPAGNEVTAQVTTDSNGDWTLTGNEVDLTPLDDGPVTVEAISTDEAGNPSSPVTAPITLDKTPPETPTITTPIEGDDIVDAVEVGDVLVEGKAEAESTIDVKFTDPDGNQVTAQATTDLNGDWTLTGKEVDLTPLDDGPVTVEAISTDKAGNPSDPVTETITLDKTPPVTPTIKTPIEVDDVVDATEFEDVLVEGTAEADSTIDVKFTDPDGNQVTAQATTDPNGDWTLTGKEVDLTPLDDGPVTVEAISTDKAGNPSNPVTATITLDKTPPVTPTIKTPIEVDDIVDAVEVSDVLVEGTAEADSTIDVKFTDPDGNQVTAQATTDPNGDWTLTGKEVDLTPLDDGPVTVEAISTDKAGNPSNPVTATITLDKTPPVTPTIKTPIEVDDIVDAVEVGDVLVEGKAEADSTIDVKFTDPAGNEVTAQVTTDPNGDWTLNGNEVDLTPLDDGPVTVEAISTDEAGNPSSPVTAPITLDKTPPVTPTITTPIEGDDIVDAVEVGDVLVEGKAEADSTIDVKFTDPAGNEVTAQVTTDPNGDWTLTGNEVDLTPLDDGPVTVEAISTDEAGNPSSPVTAPITLDKTPPETPTITTPIEGDDIVDAVEVGDVLVEGTAEADSTIDVKFTDPAGNEVTAQVTTDPNGDWTLTGSEVNLTPLDDGPVTIEVISTDKAGNPSDPITETITLDKTPPVTPTIKTPIEVDDIVDAVEVSDVLVEGTAEAESTIDVKFTDPDGNQVTAKVKTDPNGDWNLTGSEVNLTPLDDGPVTIEVISTDKAGNPSDPITETITLDKTPPETPTITTPIEGDDIVDAVEVGDVLVEGKAEADSTIDVKFTDPAGNEVTAQVTTDSNGDWTLTGNEVDLTPLDDGPVTVEAISTDEAGNPSSPVTAPITLDKTPPVPPTIKTPIEVDDIVDAVEVGDVLVEGKAEPDSTIDVKFTDPAGNEVTAQVTTDSNGDWTLTGNEVDLTPLDDGPVTVEAISTDEAGNPSSPVTAPITLDKTPPVPPTIKTPIEVDDIVDAVEVGDVLVEGKAEPDSTIDVKFTDPAGNEVTAQVTTDSNGDWTLTGNEVDLTPLDDGPVTVEAISTDGASNPSSLLTATVNKDTSIATPITPDLEVADDTGVSDTDDITSETTPTFTTPAGTATPGDTVTLYADGKPVGTATVEDDGSYQVTPDNPLPEGIQDIAVTFTDPSGNQSPLSPVLVVTIDSSSTPPTITTPIEGDNIILVAEQADVLLEGTAEPESIVDVKFTDPNGKEITTKTTTDSDGNWTLDGQEVDLTELDDGEITVSATSTDKAGNQSESVTESVTKDITLDAPIAPDLQATDDSGVSDTDDITSETTPTFTAPAQTATPGDTVTLYADGKPVGTTTVEADGSYSIAPDSPLSEGKFDIGVTFKDSTGPNATESPLSPVLPVTIDNSTSEPIITTPQKTDDTTPEITGTAEPGAIVTVGVDAGDDGTPETTYETITDVEGNWNIDLETTAPNTGSSPELNDGDVPTITVTATDEAGNTSPEVSKSLEIDIDIPALTPPTITSPATTSDTTPKITGTAQPNIKLSLEIDADDDGTPEATYETTADPQGNWSINLETATPTNSVVFTFNNGDKPTINIIAIDNAGNSSDAATQQLIIDQAVTDAPVINSPTITNDTTPEITGTAQPGINLIIEIDSDGDDTPEATYQITTNDQGRWRINLETTKPSTGSTPKLSDGDRVDITAIAISPDDNNSLEVNQKLTIDTTAPTITINPLTTRDKTPEIVGTVNDPQAKISITIDGINYDGINNGDGSWVLTDNTIANPLANGNYSIIASATDPAGNFSQSEDKLVIAAPLPKDDNIRIPRGPSGDIRIDVLANDLDLQGEILSIIDVKQPKNGRVSIDDNGTPNDSSDDRLVYTPSTTTTNNVVIEQSNISKGVFSLAGDSFQDSFSYTVRDSSGNEQTATVNVQDQVKLKFNLDVNNADWRNEIGIFKVDDAAGTINGIAPGEPGYIEAALSSGQVIFSALSQRSQLFGQNPTRIIDSFSSNDNLGFFLVQNSTADAVLAGGGATVIFGSATGNGDQFQNLNAAQIASGKFSLNWEDTTGGGDQDFNDLGLTVETTTEDTPLGSALQGGQNRELIDVTETNSAVVSTQKVIATMEVFGDSAFDNIAGLYRITDETGTIFDSVTGQTFNPGDQGYADAALRQSVGQFGEDDTGATITLDGDALYAPYLLADGSTDNIYFAFLRC